MCYKHQKNSSRKILRAVSVSFKEERQTTQTVQKSFWHCVIQGMKNISVNKNTMINNCGDDLPDPKIEFYCLESPQK